MHSQPKPLLSLRKKPHQKRSRQLVSDVLEAAIQVLKREGAHRFTTARVAAVAGTSIGSVYQYFPNKESILFRLQTEEWERSSKRVTEVLMDGSREPQARLRDLIISFFDSEVEELAIRVALGDASPLYRDAPEVKESRQSVNQAMTAFMHEALPHCTEQQRSMATNVILTAMGAIGKHVSEEGLELSAVAAHAQATADMACAYLDKLANGMRTLD